MLKAKEYNPILFLVAFVGLFTYETCKMIFIPLPQQSGIFFYSNENYPLQQVVLRFLQKAKKSIDIECFMVTDPEILSLLRLKSLKLPVSIYHHRHHPSVFIPQQRLTVSPSKRSGLMHKKMIMVDDQWILIGSTNLTETSLLMHENVMIGFHSPEMGKAIREKKPVYSSEKFTLYQLPQAKKNFLGDLLLLIDNAKSSIYVVMFCLSHEKIIKALEGAQKRGVNVEVIIDGHTYDAGLGAFFPVHRLREKHLMHHKFAIIDHTYLVFGSANWTKGGLSKNEEIEILFREAPEDLVGNFLSIFKNLRKKCQNSIDQSSKKENV